MNNGNLFTTEPNQSNHAPDTPVTLEYREALKIIHETTYTFDPKVFIEPHYLRFKPRVTAFNTLESFTLAVTPYPIGLTSQSDPENNLVHFCWFDGMYEHLNIRAESRVRLQENNPFDFLLFPLHFADLPFQYPLNIQKTLQANLNGTHVSAPLQGYGQKIIEGSGYKTIDFLRELTRQIHADFQLESRAEGDPYPADKTFALRKGSCRDLAWMQIQLLRNLGIAARFVSGYYYLDYVIQKFDLHAWLEVYLPGAGWIGFDPSYGIIAGSRHIPVCTSSHYENTMPVTGSFRGWTTSKLTSTLLIERV